jgi:hypothetical protein
MEIEFKNKQLFHFVCDKWEQEYFVYQTDGVWNIYQLSSDGYEQMNDGGGFGIAGEAIEYIVKLIKEWDRTDNESGVS